MTKRGGEFIDNIKTKNVDDMQWLIFESNDTRNKSVLAYDYIDIPSMSVTSNTIKFTVSKSTNIDAANIIALLKEYGYSIGNVEYTT